MSGLLVLPTVSSFTNQWYINTKDVLETLYFIAGIFMILTVVIAIRQLKMIQKDMNIREDRATAEKSLEVLNDFAKNVIPDINDYQARLSAEEANFTTNDKYLNREFNVNFNKFDKEALAEVDVRIELGVGKILNYLEAMSVSINYGIAKEEVVYDPLSEAFCSFIRSEYLVISLFRSQGVPYKHIVKLYKKWDKKKKLEDISKRERALEKLKEWVNKN